MGDLRKAAELAFDALDIYREHDAENIGLADAAYEALRQALAQPEQEPVAWMVYSVDGQSVCITDDPTSFTENQRALPLWPGPLEREWVGLTDEEIEEHFFNNVNTGSLLSFGAGAAYAEAKLKEKNGG